MKAKFTEYRGINPFAVAVLAQIIIFWFMAFYFLARSITGSSMIVMATICFFGAALLGTGAYTFSEMFLSYRARKEKREREMQKRLT